MIHQSSVTHQLAFKIECFDRIECWPMPSRVKMKLVAQLSTNELGWFVGILRGQQKKINEALHCSIQNTINVY